MSVSRDVSRVWRIEGMTERAIKLAKMLAVAKNVPVNYIVAAAIYRYWDAETDEATFLDEWMQTHEI